MKKRHAHLLILTCLLAISTIGCGDGPVVKTWSNDLAAATHEPHIGDYEGTQWAYGKLSKVYAQVWRVGEVYHANLLRKTDARDATIMTFSGKASADGKAVSLVQDVDKLTSLQARATLRDNELTGGAGAAYSFSLKRVARLSPTLGKPAPKGATVLLSEKTTAQQLAENFRQGSKGEKPTQWKLRPGGVMEILPRKGGTTRTARSFGAMQLHLEFKLPHLHQKRGQARSNSGVYVYTMYEVQILDSYALAGKHNECGGLYKQSAPRVNAAAPPGQWQTYDITFLPPQLAGTTVVKPAMMTVVHNGIVVQDQFPLLTGTGSAAKRTPPANKAPFQLQDHGNTVYYRNIWVKELDEKAPALRAMIASRDAAQKSKPKPDKSTQP